MTYLAILAIGFCGGLAFGLHIAEVMLKNIQHKLKQVEQQMKRQTAELDQQLAPNADLHEDFA